MESWFVPRMWDEGTCWIIGGGTSMPREFGIPEQTIQKVLEGELPLSAYDPYLKPLHGAHVIGTNVAFYLGNWVKVLFFSDAQFYWNYWRDVDKLKRLIVTDSDQLQNGFKFHKKTNHIKRLQRDYMAGLSLNARKLRWNWNSGSAAINLATLFGCRRIILLGFDMGHVNGHDHWHSGLPNYQKLIAEINYKRYLGGFNQIALDAKSLGIEILNVSSVSRITQFPKVKLKEVL